MPLLNNIALINYGFFPGNLPDNFAGIFLVVFFVILLIVLVPAILYLITLQNTLKAISPENRRTAPSNVWLALIPLFNIIWAFLIVGYIADSLRDEFAKRNQPVAEARPGYTIGLTMCILTVCSIIPIIGGLFAVGSLVCWIIYWVKIANYKNMLGGQVNNPSLDNLQN